MRARFSGYPTPPSSVRRAGSGQRIARSHYALPHGLEGIVGGAYIFIGRPERYVEMCRAELRRRRDAPVAIRASLVFALVFAGSGEEAMVAADGLIEAAEATGNPFVLSFVLAACGTAFGDTDPARAMDALGRGLVIAQDSGFALSPLSETAHPEINTAITHLRDILGDQTYESLARKGETMTTAAMATYAYGQIDQARAELNAASK